MAIAQRFDNRLSSLDERRAALANATGALAARELPAALANTRPTRIGPSDTIPLPPPLDPLMPGGLERGEAVELDTPNAEPDYLSLAVVAAALRQGLWCATIGVAGLGGAALADMVRADGGPKEPLRTLLVVSDPGEKWPDVTAVLAEGCDLLLLRPPTTASAATVRQITGRLRQGQTAGTHHSAALAVLGRWSAARATLRTEQRTWTGLHGEGPRAGTGHLTAGRALISATGKATAGRRRVVDVWLPAADRPWASVQDSSSVVTTLRRDAA